MKISSFLLSASLLLLAACSGLNTNPPVAADAPPVTDTCAIDSIRDVMEPLDSARANVACFDSLYTLFIKELRSDSGNAGKNNAVIKAFTVHAIDLFAAMGMKLDQQNLPKYNYIRVYLGFDLAAKQFKLYIVPVKGACINNQCKLPGNDLMLRPNGEPYPDPRLMPDSPQYVLDLNAPCPSICDNASPLMFR